MKPLSVALQNLFKTRQFAAADLYEWTLADGTILRHTSFDVDLVWSGQTYTAGGTVGPFYGVSTKLRAKWKIGLQVDDATFDMAPGGATVRGIPWLQAVTFGFFDGATFRRYRAYMALGSTTVVGVFLMNSARVGPMVGGRETLQVTLKAYTELLDSPVPREVFQVQCMNILYGAGCTLSRAAYAVNGSIALAGTASALITTAMGGKPDGWFDQGSVQMTSGVLAGMVMTIKAWLGGTHNSMTLIAPFPVAPQVGDTLTAYAGCDLTKATCDSKFNNLVNFRGQPYVPTPETAI